MLSVIRNQARALAPNARTKLLNEGWATYIHVHIMRQLFQEGLLTSEEHGVFSRFHSAVLRENRFGLNWYRVGYGLYEYIKEKWDLGRFGREFDECEDPAARSNWGTGANAGSGKIFEVRANFSDRMAVELLFEDEFIHGQRLYTQEQPDPDTGDIVEVIVENRPAVIRALLKQQLTLHGAPAIYIKDGNRELYMVHVRHSDSQQELDWDYERATLEKVFHLWGRPVHLETDEITGDERGQQSDVVRVVDSYDGETHTSRTLTPSS